MLKSIPIYECQRCKEKINCYHLSSIIDGKNRNFAHYTEQNKLIYSDKVGHICKDLMAESGSIITQMKLVGYETKNLDKINDQAMVHTIGKVGTYNRA